MQARGPQRAQHQQQERRTNNSSSNNLPFRHNHAAGEFTPEISPLDQFIYRGRKLKKELQHSDHSGGGADSSSRSQGPHSGRPGYAPPIGEDGDFPPRTDSRRDQPGGGPPRPAESQMPVFPRFSTITNDSYGDRESMYSTDGDSTISSIMGGFSFGFQGQQKSPNVKDASISVRREFNAGRDSIRPTISHSQTDAEARSSGPRLQLAARDSVRPVLSHVEDDASPTSTTIPTTALIAPSPIAPPPRVDSRRGPPRTDSAQGDYHRGRGRSNPGPSKNSAYARSRSQPPVHQRLPPPAQQDSGRPKLKTDPPYSARQYVPIRKDEGPISPLERQGSADSGRVAPLARTGSDHSDRLQPYRQAAREVERQYNLPARQNSGDSVTKYLPYRNNSRDASQPRQRSPDDRRPKGDSPSPQSRSGTPVLLGARAMSPESINEDGRQRRGQSPLPSPNPYTMERSSSAASDVQSIYSIGGTRLNKPALNFSRPRTQRLSTESQEDRPYIDIPPGSGHVLPTPENMTEEPEEISGSNGPAPSYIYTRFALPRGRSVERNSVVFQSHPSPAPAPLKEERKVEERPRSPPSGVPIPTPPNPQPTPKHLPQPIPPRNASRNGSLSESHADQPATPSQPPPLPRTPRAPLAPAANISPEEHLEMGIELHEKGSLQESTYHLRCAAQRGHPTGMLLYALACRHGWGMRPNQKEGVLWLKKVTQLASNQVADDEKTSSGAAIFEKRGRRAQFALSIYELGVSHLNGWGTEMDKSLALNCFEIAGSMFSPYQAYFPRDTC
jgi:hypothetical protein